MGAYPLTIALLALAILLPSQQPLSAAHPRLGPTAGRGAGALSQITMLGREGRRRRAIAVVQTMRVIILTAALPCCWR
jgi:uncharacterized membrane protein AbrB (regulator of aidB expression)